MESVTTDGTFEDILTKSSPAACELAYAVRALIGEVYPAAFEVPWIKQRIAGYGVGSKKGNEHFCYISAHKDYVNLGFNFGTTLPDPSGLLEGTGKLFRHVKIKQLDDLHNTALRELLQAAVEERLAATKKAA